MVGIGNADAFQDLERNITPIIENIVKALPIAVEAVADLFYSC